MPAALIAALAVTVSLVVTSMAAGQAANDTLIQNNAVVSSNS